MASLLPETPPFMEQYRVTNPHTNFLVGRNETIEHKLRVLREFQQEFPGTPSNIHWGEGCNYTEFRRETPKGEEWLCVLLNLNFLESEFDYLHKRFAA